MISFTKTGSMGRVFYCSNCGINWGINSINLKIGGGHSRAEQFNHRCSCGQINSGIIRIDAYQQGDKDIAEAPSASQDFNKLF